MLQQTQNWIARQWIQAYVRVCILHENLTSSLGTWNFLHCACIHEDEQNMCTRSCKLAKQREVAHSSNPKIPTRQHIQRCDDSDPAGCDVHVPCILASYVCRFSVQCSASNSVPYIPTKHLCCLSAYMATRTGSAACVSQCSTRQAASRTQPHSTALIYRLLAKPLRDSSVYVAAPISHQYSPAAASHTHAIIPSYTRTTPNYIPHLSQDGIQSVFQTSTLRAEEWRLAHNRAIKVTIKMNKQTLPCSACYSRAGNLPRLLCCIILFLLQN